MQMLSPPLTAGFGRRFFLIHKKSKKTQFDIFRQENIFQPGVQPTILTDYRLPCDCIRVWIKYPEVKLQSGDERTEGIYSVFPNYCDIRSKTRIFSRKFLPGHFGMGYDRWIPVYCQDI